MAEDRAIEITVLYSSAPRRTHEWCLILPPGTTLLQALQASGLQEVFPELDLLSTVTGIWGRKAPLDQVLRTGDRVEVYRLLTVDPKLARRERFRKQGVRAAGLFARKKATPGPQQ